MSRNGSGTYSLPSGNPVVTGTVISSTWANTTLNDIASALTTSIASDGQTPITANLPMSGYKLTGLGTGANPGDSVRYEQIFPSLSTSTLTISGGLTAATASIDSGGLFIGSCGSVATAAGCVNFIANTGAFIANRSGASAATSAGNLTLQIDGTASGYVAGQTTSFVGQYDSAGTLRWRWGILGIQWGSTASQTARLFFNNSSSDGMYHQTFQADGIENYRVALNGNVLNMNNSYGALSDARLKENITDATPKLDALMRLRVVTFNRIGDKQKQIGLIAQEVREVFPGLVEEDAEGTLSVKYSVLVPILLKALQELNERVNRAY